MKPAFSRCNDGAERTAVSVEIRLTREEWEIAERLAAELHTTRSISEPTVTKYIRHIARSIVANVMESELTPKR